MNHSAQSHTFAGLADALYHRMNPAAPVSERGRGYATLSVIDAGRQLLESNGVSTRGRPASELLSMMHQFRSMTGSDFPSLLANVANKRLRDAYLDAPRSYLLWARRAPDLQDFRPATVVQMSGAPDLLRVAEHGEFTYGKMTDSGESYSLMTYGRIVSLTRQAIINDDLRSFDRVLAAYAAAASRLENRLVYAQLTSNPTMSDGTALFHSTRGNLGTGAGSALQSSSLAAARTAMRLQKGLNGEELNLFPSFLLVPAELEQTAYQLTSSAYVPATANDVNEFRTGGRTSLTPVVEPLLSSDSGSRWYAVSASALCDTVEFAYLAGNDAPRVETQSGFTSDAFEVKCVLDFAAKAVDWRGVYRADGA